MIKCHACQDTLSHAGSLTLRLFLVAAFLLVSLLDPSDSCHFSYNPISTTFNRPIKNLSKWLLLDYPVSITSNLKPDSWCSELWQLQLMKKELERMREVAGEELKVYLEDVWKQIAFLKHCNSTVSTSCLTGERTNVSNFLGLLEQQINVLKIKFRGQKNLDFSNCTQILCMPVQMTGSDSMMTSGPSQPAKDEEEDHQRSTASSEMSSRLKGTPGNADGYAQGSTTAVDSRGWLKRAHVWLGISIFLIALVVACWCFWSSRKKQTSVTLNLQQLS